MYSILSCNVFELDDICYWEYHYLLTYSRFLEPFQFHPMFVCFSGSTEVIVYSAQGSNDPVTSAMHIIFGTFVCLFFT